MASVRRLVGSNKTCLLIACLLIVLMFMSSDCVVSLPVVLMRMSSDCACLLMTQNISARVSSVLLMRQSKIHEITVWHY